MAPKRGSSSKRPRNDAFDTTRFVSAEAAEQYAKLANQPIVAERGFINEPPFTSLFARLHWERFVNAPKPAGTRELTLEFYANFTAHPNESTIFLRGKRIDISSPAINAFYGLPDFVTDGFETIARAGVTDAELITVLSGSNDPPLFPTWTYIPRARLSREAKTLYYFVASRLMPTVVNSQVQKNRAFLTYALLKGLTIDVGKVVREEIITVLGGKKWYSMGFPALIHGLAVANGVRGQILTDGPIKPKLPVSLKLIDQGSRQQQQRNAPPAQQQQQNVPPEPSHDEEEDDESEDDSLSERMTAMEGHMTEMRRDIASIRTDNASLRTYIEEQFTAVLARLPPPSLPPP